MRVKIDFVGTVVGKLEEGVDFEVEDSVENLHAIQINETKDSLAISSILSRQ